MDNSQWQPIETAPRDGTPLLLFSPAPDKWKFAGGNTTSGALIWVSGGWRETGGWRGDYHKDPPTHWMPLPDPPKN